MEDGILASWTSHITIDFMEIGLKVPLFQFLVIRWIGFMQRYDSHNHVTLLMSLPLHPHQL